MSPLPRRFVGRWSAWLFGGVFLSIMALCFLVALLVLTASLALNIYLAQRLVTPDGSVRNPISLSIGMDRAPAAGSESDPEADRVVLPPTYTPPPVSINILGSTPTKTPIIIVLEAPDTALTDTLSRPTQSTERMTLAETPIPTVSPVSTPSAPAGGSSSSNLDFIVQKVRLRTNEENGGFSPNGSAANCGYGHHIFVEVVDAAGNPLDGVVIGDTYNNPRQITGSKGPGRAEYTLYGNGYNLLVIEYAGLERPVTSEVSPVMSAKDEEIPIEWLIEGHYCATEAECLERVKANGLCRSHYSYDIVFQRTW